MQKITLTELLELTVKMFPELDIYLVLKSLVYFDDIEEEPINFKHNKQIDFDVIKIFLNKEVKKYLNKDN